MGNISTMSRIHTFSSSPQSRVFAAILGRTVIGPVIEVRVAKILGEPGFGIAIPSLHNRENTSYVGFVDENHDSTVEFRPSTELFLNCGNQKGENLAWKNSIIASRKFVPTMLQTDVATRKLVQTISAVLIVVHLCSRRLPFVRTKGSGWLFPPVLSMETLFR